MVIYLARNTVNNKVYFGKTEKTVLARYSYAYLPHGDAHHMRREEFSCNSI